jgi:hypothetical protein
MSEMFETFEEFAAAVEFTVFAPQPPPELWKRQILFNGDIAIVTYEEGEDEPDFETRGIVRAEHVLRIVEAPVRMAVVSGDGPPWQDIEIGAYRGRMRGPDARRTTPYPDGFSFCQVEFVAEGTDLRLQSSLLEPAGILAFARMLEPVTQTRRGSDG